MKTWTDKKGNERKAISSHIRVSPTWNEEGTNYEGLSTQFHKNEAIVEETGTKVEIPSLGNNLNIDNELLALASEEFQANTQKLAEALAFFYDRDIALDPVKPVEEPLIEEPIEED